MLKKISSQSGATLARFVLILMLCGAAVSLAWFSFAASSSPNQTALSAAALPTFGHPVISGVGGEGFEQDLRVDPSNSNRLYTSVPGALSSDTSWIWRSLDAGKTFKWIPNSTPLTGKGAACAGGGDTELGVDSNGHLYFADLTLANFSTARSDDQGASFTCSNTGVPDTVVDRQWYAFDGDPTNGGSIYLVNDETGPGMPNCPGATIVGNLLVMYRSPAGGASSTAGIQFGPRNPVSGLGTCNEGIMGNNEVSPVATTLGQPLTANTYATLPTPVKHVFVIHDNGALNQIWLGRCFPVAFGPAVPNLSDPSGLNCTDIMVKDLGANRTGGNFPTMGIDKAGNLYAVWPQAPYDANNGVVTGDTVLKFSYSTDQGNTWSNPITIDTSAAPGGALRNNVMPWLVAGDDGRVGIGWFGTPGAPSYPSNGPDDCPATCNWSVWYTMSTNAHSASPTFTAPMEASEHFIHRGSIQTLIGGQNGDRTLGDFLQVRMGPQGEAMISYSDSNNIDEGNAPHAMFVRQNGGDGLLATISPVNVAGLRPFNSVSDPAGDGRYEANSTVSANMPQLDITGSSMRQVTTPPCIVGSPCYEVTMQINNLSLAPTTAQDPDTDLVWLTQWLVPSSTDPLGGKNFFVYAESNNGGALQCFAGENAENRIAGGVGLTYPGTTTLPAANCNSTLGANGTITIYVPLSVVAEANPIDNKLHEVTASTMTLQAQANSVPPVSANNRFIGGVFFNPIDIAQSYVFDPSLVTAPPGIQLVNISGRALVQTGDKIADGGFIVRGAPGKRVLLRGIGPSLAVPGALQDPMIELHDGTGATVAVNDNWKATQQTEIQQTGLAPSDDRESAIVATLAAGNYTVILRGSGNSIGIGVVEVYDLDPPSGSELVNESVRADVQTNDNVLIDGTIIAGVTQKRVMFRALGPSLSVSGTPIAGRLMDPVMELHDTNGTLIASNDNWKTSSNAAEIQASTLAPPDDRESAILLPLGPGNYTTIVRGAGATTGIAINEIYRLDN
ncbi:MAG: hypothetical protein ABR611_04870 [Chthoniobacterales bacterium]